MQQFLFFFIKFTYFQFTLRIDPDIVKSKDEPKFIGKVRLLWGSDLARQVLQVHIRQAPKLNKRTEDCLSFNFPGINDVDIKKQFKDVKEIDFKQCEKVLIFIRGRS